MLIQFGVDDIEAEWKGAVVCLGTFDGIHLGHAEVIRRAVDWAAERETASVVVTFDRHPTTVLAPDRAPLPVYSLGQNLDRIAEIGPSAVVILKFDQELADCPAETFLQSVIRQKLHAEAMVVGHDFAFGHKRVGTGEWLQKRIECHIVDPVHSRGHRVSSSDIRRAILAGDLESAGVLLGHPFEIAGAVIQGEKRGRAIGFPTANIARLTPQITPPNGVYAGSLRVDGATYAAAVGIGIRPTVGGDTRTIEAYLLDYPGTPIYGKAVRLALTHRLRDEQKFDSVDEMSAQIGRDVEEVRKRAVIASDS